MISVPSPIYFALFVDESLCVSFAKKHMTRSPPKRVKGSGKCTRELCVELEVRFEVERDPHSCTQNIYTPTKFFLVAGLTRLRG